jgi:D-3-phosphoglycerate dehydrogenase
MSFKILVTARSFRKTPGEHKRLLEEAGCEIVESSQDRPLKEGELLDLISDVDGVILGMDEATAKVISAGKRLRVISRYGVGIDNVDLAAATASGVVVTNTPGANSIAVAELTLGLMLSLARRIPQHYVSAKAGSWSRMTGVELADKTLGIVGLGQISREVIARAACFSMRILVHTGYPDKGLTDAYDAEYVPLDHLLRESDFVSLHCSLTPERIKFIGERELKTMKPTSYLINTARGELVDEVALYRALREGWITGAASDVFAQEPPAGNPLLELDNFIVSPHTAANTYESVRRMGVLASENALKVLRGERPLHVMNPEVYVAGGR